MYHFKKRVVKAVNMSAWMRNELVRLIFVHFQFAGVISASWLTCECPKWSYMRPLFWYFFHCLSFLVVFIWTSWLKVTKSKCYLYFTFSGWGQTGFRLKQSEPSLLMSQSYGGYTGALGLGTSIPIMEIITKSLWKSCPHAYLAQMNIK